MHYFYDSWNTLLRTLTIGLCAYFVLVILLRVSGKRTLSKWNAFDFIVTIALGSTLATQLLSKDTTLAQGATAFSVLIFLQLIITWLSVRLDFVKRWITGEPTLLLRNGQFRHDALKQQRVTEGEVRAAIRGQGIGAVEAVAAVVLETDGSFSVIKSFETDRLTALTGVQGLDAAANQS